MPSEPPQDIYVRHLLSDRGYPLWVPEPSRRLPEDYLKEGVRIGDVGVVTENGSFDVFFNICLPLDHPLHERHGVPDNFDRVELASDLIDVFPAKEERGRVVASLSARQAERSDESSARTEYKFFISPQEGALLVLPHGAEHHDLRIKRRFQDEALKHAVDWYDFAEQRLQRLISHDALYLITGFYKARSWALASFPTIESTGESLIWFTTAHSYTWRRDERALLEHRTGSPDNMSNGIPNQAVFISGFKIAINDELLFWKRIDVKAETGPEKMETTAIVGSGSWFPSLCSNLARMGGVAMPSGSGSGVSQASIGDVIKGDVRVSHVPQISKMSHPSDIINKWLFSKEPSAKIAVTHDTEWSSLLAMRKLELESLLEREALVSTSSVDNDVVLQDGAVFLRHKAVPHDDPINTSRNIENLNDTKEVMESRSSTAPSSKHPDLPDLTNVLLPVLDTARIVKKGPSAVVYQCSSPIGEVAVKSIFFRDDRVKRECSTQMMLELERWRRLNHSNIVPLLGWTRGDGLAIEQDCFVLKWMPNGTLHEYVKRHGAILSLPRCINLIKSCAAGLEYLHSCNIVHGDLHPGNILIDEEHNARLTDLGLLQVITPVNSGFWYNPAYPGAATYYPPEILCPQLYPDLKATLASDIYSFGCILFFILSLQDPWSGKSEAESKLRVSQRPPRPTWPTKFPDDVWEFIVWCWSGLPNVRPSANEVLTFVDGKLEQLLRPNPSSLINVVLFGPVGCGKSSLINLLSEKAMARVSKDGKPCTKGTRKYEIRIDGRWFQLWDTIGFELGEGANLLAFYEQACAVLQNLADGVNLILLCASGDEMHHPSLGRLYSFINNFVYRGHAPMALVATHSDTLDIEWWQRNQQGIHRTTSIPFESLPYVSTTIVRAGRDRSREAVKSLLLNYAATILPISANPDLSDLAKVSSDLAIQYGLDTSEAMAILEKFDGAASSSSSSKQFSNIVASRSSLKSARKHVRFNDDSVFYTSKSPASSKQLRFKHDNIFYTPKRTPSPSTASSVDSSGPRTPQQQNFDPLPLPGSAVVVNTLLMFHPYQPPLIYNVSLPPNQAFSLAPALLAEPATQPSMHTMTLTIDQYPWQLVIPPTQPYVSVRDLLEALYTFLRRPVLPPEYNSLPTQEIKDEVSLAFYDRCGRATSKEGTEQERQKGLKRVDFLRGRTRFLGLSSTKAGPSVWMLNLARTY